MLTSSGSMPVSLYDMSILTSDDDIYFWYKLVWGLSGPYI